MIDQPFPLPTNESTHVSDIEEYNRLSLDEQIELAIMMLMKYGKEWLNYKILYFQGAYVTEYAVITDSVENDEIPIIQLPLGAMMMIYERVKFVVSDSGHTPSMTYDSYSTEPLSLLSMCEFLYGLTRKGTIDSIIDEI